MLPIEVFLYRLGALEAQSLIDYSGPVLSV